jgi:hypothetical protein
LTLLSKKAPEAKRIECLRALGFLMLNLTVCRVSDAQLL